MRNAALSRLIHSNMPDPSDVDPVDREKYTLRPALYNDSLISYLLFFRRRDKFVISSYKV